MLGDEDAAVLARYFGVTEEGNFEGRNVLHRFSAPEAVAEGLGITPEELAETVARGSEKLHAVRRTREWPLRDEKVLTAWNAMVLGALAEAAATLERADYLEEARVTARFLLGALRQNGRVLRTYRDGQAKLPGYLEDYAFLVDGLISLYEASLEQPWLEEARALADAMLDLFWDEGRGTFYDTARDHETLIVRPRDIFDNAMPCGSSTATLALLRLGALTGQEVYRGAAVRALRSVRGLLAQHPAGFGHWLCALDFYLSTPKEVAIVGPRDDAGTSALLAAAHRDFLPNKVVAGQSRRRRGKAAASRCWRCGG